MTGGEGSVIRVAHMGAGFGGVGSGAAPTPSAILILERRG